MPGLASLFHPLDGDRGPYIMKPANETYAISNTPHADADLFFETEANSVYEIELMCVSGSSGTSDPRFFFDHTGTTTYWLSQGVRSASSHAETLYSAGTNVAHLQYQDTMTVVWGHTGTGGLRSGLRCQAFLVTGASGGTFSFQWYMSGAGTMTMYAGSYMIVRRLSDLDVVYKASDTTRTGTATMTADPDLVRTLTPGKWWIQIGFREISGATNDFKYSLSFSGSLNTSCIQGVHSDAASLWTTNIDVNEGPCFSACFNETIIAASTAFPIPGSNTANTHAGGVLRGVVDVSSEGDLSLIWAQNTSGADNAIMKAGSYMIAIPIVEMAEEFTVKSSNQTKNSDTALADDSELVVALEANKKYVVRIHAMVYSPATPDMDIAITVTGSPIAVLGGGVRRVITGNGATSSTALTGNTWGQFHTTPVETTFAGTATSTDRGIWEIGLGIIMDSSSGTASLQWAQNVSDSGNTTVFAGGYINVIDVTQ